METLGTDKEPGGTQEFIRHWGAFTTASHLQLLSPAQASPAAKEQEELLEMAGPGAPSRQALEL